MAGLTANGEIFRYARPDSGTPDLAHCRPYVRVTNLKNGKIDSGFV